MNYGKYRHIKVGLKQEKGREPPGILPKSVQNGRNLGTLRERKPDVYKVTSGFMKTPTVLLSSGFGRRVNIKSVSWSFSSFQKKKLVYATRNLSFMLPKTQSTLKHRAQQREV